MKLKYPIDVAGIIVRGGTAKGGGETGTPREPLPSTMQSRIDTYPRCIQTSLHTYQNALFLQSNIEELSARAPNAALRLTRVHEHIFAVPPVRYPLSMIPTS